MLQIGRAAEPRYLATHVRQNALAARKMAVIRAPRQVGKTTLATGLLESSAYERFLAGLV
jgi:predicted AAA+ superfamily ATPase